MKAQFYAEIGILSLIRARQCASIKQHFAGKCVCSNVLSN